VAGKEALLDSDDPPRRTYPIDLNALVQPYLGPILVGLVGAFVVLILLLILVVRRVVRVDRRLRAITRGEEGGSLEGVLDAHLEKVYGLTREVERLVARTGALETAGVRAFQRVGLVRFNPFEDTGGNQSFALALLDAEGNGWVLSSLHARTGTRVYAKAIQGGRSDAALSDEETAAIRQATA
jgi:hypothetical protein